MKKRVILIFAFLFLVLTILFFSSFVLKEETNSSFSISSFIKGITSRVIQFIIPASNAEHLDSSRRFL